MEYNDESCYKRREASDFRGCCRSGLVIYGTDGRRGGAKKEVIQAHAKEVLNLDI